MKLLYLCDTPFRLISIWSHKQVFAKLPGLGTSPDVILWEYFQKLVMFSLLFL